MRKKKVTDDEIGQTNKKEQENFEEITDLETNIRKEEEEEEILVELASLHPNRKESPLVLDVFCLFLILIPEYTK